MTYVVSSQSPLAKDTINSIVFDVSYGLEVIHLKQNFYKSVVPTELFLPQFTDLLEEFLANVYSPE